MALGGGTFLVQNKILPGAYINFVSVPHASAALSDRGIAALPLPMSWGPEGEIFTVERADFFKNSQKIFGYAYTAPQLLPMREIFINAKTVHFFRLNQGGKTAENELAAARYPGARGSDLRVAVESGEHSSEDAPRFDVVTLLDAQEVDRQKDIAAMSELADNDFLIWKRGASLSLTAGMPLTGGADGPAADAAYQRFLEQAESVSFNAMGCSSADPVIKGLFAAFCKRMRDEAGKKFQAVVFNHLADCEGVVSVKNGLADDADSPALVPWVTGLIAGTAVNKSAANTVYDGEYAPGAAYTQAELEAGVLEGSFLLHRVDGEVRVLEDINTFVSVTDEKSADFSSNQTVRVLDQIANDIAVLFGKKYIGKIPNDAAGRISLWADIVKHHQQLESIRAIENFSPEDVTVEKGDTKKSVVVTDRVSPVNAMMQLYMTVLVE